MSLWHETFKTTYTLLYACSGHLCYDLFMFFLLMINIIRIPYLMDYCALFVISAPKFLTFHCLN